MEAENRGAPLSDADVEEEPAGVGRADAVRAESPDRLQEGPSPEVEVAGPDRWGRIGPELEQIGRQQRSVGPAGIDLHDALGLEPVSDLAENPAAGTAPGGLDRRALRPGAARPASGPAPGGRGPPRTSG